MQFGNHTSLRKLRPDFPKILLPLFLLADYLAGMMYRDNTYGEIPAPKVPWEGFVIIGRIQKSHSHRVVLLHCSLRTYQEKFATIKLSLG